MKCLRCLNTDPRQFYVSQGKHYCRRCLDFGRLEADTRPLTPALSRKVLQIRPHLEFELTPFQQAASDQTLSILKSGRDVLVYAAAGAGKTEITLASIAWYLSQGKKVCFAISRRQVVMEIAQRLQKNFPTLEVIPVCQGYTRQTDADLIVCTTHQLYRYPFCFDLLILDELDAFPYAGNVVLENIAEQSCIGQKLMLSATPDENSLEQIAQGRMEMVNLFARPHGKPLCIPRVILCSKPRMVLRILRLCFRFRKEKKQVLVFVPRIADTRWMRLVLGCFFRCGVIHSKSRNKDEVMERFHARQSEVLICTTLLERGITVPSVQVIVYRAEHPVFTKASLIQIFGRTGRTFSDPEGEGYALCLSPSRAVGACVKQLEAMNAARGVRPGSPAQTVSKP